MRGRGGRALSGDLVAYEGEPNIVNALVSPGLIQLCKGYLDGLLDGLINGGAYVRGEGGGRCTRYKWYYYVALSHKDWELPNSGV